MIVVLSQFRVANGMEEAVRQAFANRPHLVEGAPGFLGMEVFRGSDDPSIFLLTTQWSDIESFRVWHASEAHRLSHCGIPKGLRLDPAQTQLTFLHEIEGNAEPMEHGTAGDAWTELLVNHAQRSAALHLLVTDGHGEILACNSRIAGLLGVPQHQLCGQILWPYLTALDAVTLQKLMRGSGEEQAESTLLNFVSAEGLPHTLECTIHRQKVGCVVIGNIPSRQGEELRRQIIEINNEMAVLLREHAAANKDLAAAKRDLEKALQEITTLYWQIRKVREVLPMCLKCGKVQSGETHWEDLADFMIERFPFLSHGYCPDCAARERVDDGETGIES
jgi:heme-degrading monooxygenase HmoA